MAEGGTVRPNLLYLIHSRPFRTTTLPSSEDATTVSRISPALQYQSVPFTQHESEYSPYLTLHVVTDGEGQVDLMHVPGGTEAIEFRQYQEVHSTSSQKWQGKRQCSPSGNKLVA